ncbi:hypothetical protein FDECE_11582 [Fusarium decemcellulare]|nr:hypothetical protein FDECE_11582 [Fusarium decemcellulare]
MLRLVTLLSLGLPLVAASSSPEPCALVNKYVEESRKKNSTTSTKVPAQLAEDCLESMPFYPKLAASFLDELSKYIQWQSTLEVLKNPPDTYTSSAVDILGGLEEIRETEYSSHWEFDRAINSLVASANDGHFYLTQCSFSIFTFLRGDEPIVSVSKDGLETPGVYLSEDAKLLNSTSAKVSDIVSIDGEDAEKYLSKIVETKDVQDPDARYNYAFYSRPGMAGSSSYGVFLKDDLYSGKNTTTLEFRNGTTAELPNTALVGGNFAARNGKDVFDLFCRPEKASNSSTPTSSTQSNDAGSSVKPPYESGPTGYPEPFIREPYNQMNGYYLDDETVVMLIPSFNGAGLPEDHSLWFANAATKIVDKALEDGRTKIIIDVSSNPGGSISRAFDLFKLFFPDEFPYSATRFRRHEVSEGVVKVLSVVNDTVANNNVPMGYTIQVTPDQEEDFESYQDFLGDATELGVKVSSLYANFNYTLLSGGSDEAPIRGYAGRPLQKQPFKAEDILIIGDAICSSTCTTFVNLMVNVGGVATLSFGGRPNGKPMQLMGGVRGGQSLGFDKIYGLVANAGNIFKESPEKLDFISKEEIASFMKVAPQPLEKFPIVLKQGNVNLRNAYQEGDDDLPLQFQYQASDCRLYYTTENVLQPETTWKSAKEAWWGEGSCVKGSTGGDGSLEDKKAKEGEKKKKEGGSEEPKKAPDSGAAGVTVGWGMLAMAIATVMSLV